MHHALAVKTWFPPTLVLAAVLLAAPARAGLIIDPTDDATGVISLRATQLFGVDKEPTPAQAGWNLPERLRLDELSPASQSGVLSVFAEPDHAAPQAAPQRPACLIGLTLFRSRTSKKWLRPLNDSDPWQLIFSRASMVC